MTVRNFNPGSEMQDTEILLIRFNRRDPEAFGTVYSFLYDKTVAYADRLYLTTEVDSEDAVSKVFYELWQNSQRFESMQQILAYILVALRNDYKDYLKHLKHKNSYRDYVRREREFFETALIETEIFSYLNHILQLLPEESAHIMRRFFDGFSTEEIATETGKSKQTIYNRKHETLKLLKKVLSELDLKIILMFLG